MTKLKAFAEDKFKDAKMTIFVFDRVENTMGKAESVSYQRFVIFRLCFSNPASIGC